MPNKQKTFSGELTSILYDRIWKYQEREKTQLLSLKRNAHLKVTGKMKEK